MSLDQAVTPSKSNTPTNLALIPMQNSDNRLYPVGAIEMLPWGGNIGVESLAHVTDPLYV